MAGQTPWIPVSAEDFARRKRRIVWISIGGTILVLALGTWIYKRAMDPINAQNAFDAGQRFVRATRYPQAIASYTEAIGLKPDFADAYSERGRAHIAVAELEPGIADFTKVIQLRPNDVQTYIDRASAYLTQSNFQSARDDCQRAIERDAKIAAAYNICGTATRELGDAAKALQYLSTAVDLAPNMDNYFQRSSTYQVLSEHRLAIADLDQVIAAAPDSAQAYYARSQSLRALGDVKAAERDYAQGRLLDHR